MPSSKPYHRCAKKTWPEISPASGAPVPFITDFIRLWAGFHISGLPPSSATRSNRAWLALTSAMIVEPGSASTTGSGEDREQWAAPDPPALAVAPPDPVGFAVERDAEVELIVADEPLEVLEIGL